MPGYDAGDEIELVGLGGGGQVVTLPGGELRIEGQGNAITGRTVNGGYELTDADGRVYRFGTTPQARKASGAQTSFWYLESVTDVGGHEVVYSYRQSLGEVYLESVEWGPAVNGARAFRAALEYEPRNDVVVSYRTGFRVESAERLARVRVGSFGVAQRVVTLGYEAGFALTRVKSVSVMSGDGVDALPETRFRYAAPQLGQLETVAGMSSSWALNQNGTSLFDVDEDGAMDLLSIASGGHRWRRNVGGQFAAEQPLQGAASATLGGVRLVDLNGDSLAEMVWQQGSVWKVFPLELGAARWGSPVILGGVPGTLTLSGVTFCDLDGDQRMDVLSTNGSQIDVRMGVAGGLAAAVGRPAIDAARPQVKPGAAAASFPDLNGDGLADVVFQASSMLYLYLGRGDGSFEHYRDVPYPAGPVALGQLRLADLNRDGLLDMAVVSAGNVAWYRGLPGGSFDSLPVQLSRPQGSDAGVVVAVADANGNGSEDLVWSSAAGGMWILDFVGPDDGRHADGDRERHGADAAVCLRRVDDADVRGADAVDEGDAGVDPGGGVESAGAVVRGAGAVNAAGGARRDLRRGGAAVRGVRRIDGDPAGPGGRGGDETVKRVTRYASRAGDGTRAARPGGVRAGGGRDGEDLPRDDERGGSGGGDRAAGDGRAAATGGGEGDGDAAPRGTSDGAGRRARSTITTAKGG